MVHYYTKTEHINNDNTPDTYNRSSYKHFSDFGFYLTTGEDGVTATADGSFHGNDNLKRRPHHQLPLTTSSPAYYTRYNRNQSHGVARNHYNSSMEPDENGEHNKQNKTDRRQERGKQQTTRSQFHFNEGKLNSLKLCSISLR